MKLQEFKSDFLLLIMLEQKMRVMYAHVGSTQSRSTSDTFLLAAELVGEIYVRSWQMMGLV
jgi:hypothetical protein